ncbi:MAG: DNA-processing protein DprA [Clostridia bacterium]|nr:DNA-processing protein DprA [Clostridia bacterium]
MKDTLEIRTRDYAWFKSNTQKYKQDEDYFIKNTIQEYGKNLKKNIENYYVTQDVAKKICFEQNGKIAKKICEEIIKDNKRDVNDIIEKEILQIKEEERIQDIKVIKFADEEYPERLRTIKKPPEKLYVKGNMELLKQNSIAVVGSRKYSVYGQNMCKKFVNNLVGYNLNIISGIAAGIDACAHRGCLNAKGKTIVVLPCGLKNIYPIQNKKLYEEILQKGGLIVSEYEPDEKESSDHFRERNRIVAGLAIGTLVIEARRNSGASITVRHTIEQGKKAFCIPSSLENSRGLGTNQMIRDKRAKLVMSVEDIIEEYPELNLTPNDNFDFYEITKKENETNLVKNKKSNKLKEELAPSEKQKLEVSEEYQEIYNNLTEESQSINELSRKTNKSISEVTTLLTLMQLEDLIEETAGKKYRKKT